MPAGCQERAIDFRARRYRRGYGVVHIARIFAFEVPEFRCISENDTPAREKLNITKVRERVMGIHKNVCVVNTDTLRHVTERWECAKYVPPRAQGGNIAIEESRLWRPIDRFGDRRCAGLGRHRLKI